MPVCSEKYVIKAIFRFIESFDECMSFADLHQVKELRGDAMLCHKDMNVFIGFLIHPIVVFAINSLLMRDAIEIKEVDESRYLESNCVVKAPIAYGKTTHPYKELHWQPSVLCRGKNFQKELKRLEMDNDKN